MNWLTAFPGCLKPILRETLKLSNTVESCHTLKFWMSGDWEASWTSTDHETQINDCSSSDTYVSQNFNMNTFCQVIFFHFLSTIWFILSSFCCLAVLTLHVFHQSWKIVSISLLFLKERLWSYEWGHLFVSHSFEILSLLISAVYCLWFWITGFCLMSSSDILDCSLAGLMFSNDPSLHTCWHSVLYTLQDSV